MFVYPAEIRRAIYTTNTIESLNMTLRKVRKDSSPFPNDEGVFKQIYLALQHQLEVDNADQELEWSGALNQFAILFAGRVPMGGLISNSLTQTA
jgi:putative transposase